VLMFNETSLDVTRGGKLIAMGTADQPIVFDALDPTQPWASITTAYSTPTGFPEDTIGGHVVLANVTLNNGGEGGDDEPDAVLVSHGDDVNVDDLPMTTHFDVQHVTIDTAQAGGVRFDLDAAFSASSTDLTIKHVMGTPIETGIRTVGTIPDGSYTGNLTDVILLHRDASALTRDTAMRDHGVPYQLGTDDDSEDFFVGTSAASPTATLTIDAGVTLRFATNASLTTDVGGILVAQGTAAAPIVFTSDAASPAPGAWAGLFFAGAPLAGNVIDHATVSFAGAEIMNGGSHCDVGGSGPVDGFGAINFAVQPVSAIVTNTTISSALHDGINRGYTGDPVDFLPTNTFTAVGGCKQTFPLPTTGECPDPVPCP